MQKKLNLFLESLNDSVKDLVGTQNDDDCSWCDDSNAQDRFDSELEDFYKEFKNKFFTQKQALKLRNILGKLDIGCSFKKGILTDIDCFVEPEKVAQ
jgi:hypothetical protein